MKKLLVLLSLFLVGCANGPTTREVTLSKLNVIIRKEFNDTNFPKNGITGEKDYWKQDILWEVTADNWHYTLYVRSPGQDRLPYTKDDIIVSAKYGVGNVSENFIKGILRGAVSGFREGLDK